MLPVFKADPAETTNLADQEEYASLIMQMKERIFYLIQVRSMLNFQLHHAVPRIMDTLMRLELRLCILTNNKLVSMYSNLVIIYSE